ncbi:unnamed protein product [Caenorhabditis brenneri]
MNGKLDQQPFRDELLSVKSLIACGVALVPLAVCYLWWLPSYNRAIEKNLDVHERSPLFPLFNCSSIIIFYVYPIYSMLVILYGMCGIVIKFIESSVFVAIVLSFGIEWMSTTYQTLIALISIHRFLNNRRSPDHRRNPLNLCYMICLVCAVLVVNFLLESLVMNSVFSEKAKKEFIFRGLVIYIPQQILLFIAMVLQFSMTSVPVISYSENNVVIHTKIIGAIKFVLFIVAGITRTRTVFDTVISFS